MTKQLVLYLEEINPRGGLDTRIYLVYQQNDRHFSAYFTRDDPSKKRQIFGEHIIHLTHFSMLTFFKNIFDPNALMNLRLYIINTPCEKTFHSYKDTTRFNDEVFGYDKLKIDWDRIDSILAMLSGSIANVDESL
jgi:hypothetical protein